MNRQATNTRTSVLVCSRRHVVCQESKET